jgi:hypothetical protein
MKKRLLTGIGVFLATGVLAQAGAEEDVRAVIARLFKGMQLGDSAMVRSTFAADIQFVTITSKQDGTSAKHIEPSAAPFLKALGTPHAEVWNEEIWNLKIVVDGSLAQAWCDYAFYVGKKFSHCGADAFLLHKEREGWKIFHLADTRRLFPCVMPKEIEDRYK